MSDFEAAIRGVSERFKPAIVFAARLAAGDEVPEELRPDDPFQAWGAEHGAELRTAVEVAGSQRRTGENRDELVTILAGLRFKPDAIAWLVGLYITAAYWFTASTSFANPAVAIARSLTDTFAGIRPVDLPGFIAAECVGAALAVAFFTWLLQTTQRPKKV